MTNILQNLDLNQLVVLALPRSKAQDMLSLVSDLAIRGALRVVDGGNLFNILTLSRMIRRRTNNVVEVLNRIYISRAFTCFQMESMLHELQTRSGCVLVLDLLATFYDENVDTRQSQQLFTSCVRHLKRQSSVSPVLVSISPSPKAGERPFLTQMLLESANHIWQWERKPSLQSQPMLWE
jgi:hypothetical protein